MKNLVAHFLQLFQVRTRESTMQKKELVQQVAKLESINDQLASEIRELDRLARSLGFSDGIETLKAAAVELIEERQMEMFDLEDEEDPPFLDE